MLERLTPLQIQSALEETRRACRSGYCTNYALQSLPPDGCNTLHLAKTTLFFCDDTGFQRLYFLSGDPSELAAGLGQAGTAATTIDLLARDLPEDYHQAFLGAGYHCVRVSQRFQGAPSPDWKEADEDPDGKAITAETSALHERLCREFDRYCDHLPSLTELKEWVEAGWVLVNRRSGKIQSYLVYNIKGGRCHLNYWHRGPEDHPLEAVHLLKRLHAETLGRKVPVIFGWVDREKVRVREIYRRLGFALDGMHDFIYLRLP